jgi:hypothetical protein
MTERRRVRALGEALKAMFRRLEARETPTTLRATVEQLDAEARAEEADAEPREPPGGGAPGPRVRG